MERAFICFTFAFSAILAQKTQVPECGDSSVCTSLLRNSDGLTVNKGPFCHCGNTRSPPCDGSWESDSSYTLTWQHYEKKGHGTAITQYKFCTSMFHERLCNPGERAATVTKQDPDRLPVLAEPRCRCSNYRFHMDGWKNEGNQWKDFYSCEKSECVDSVPCAKIIYNNNADYGKVQEIQSLCACPEGQKCVSMDYWHSNLNTDGQGATYVNGSCRDNSYTYSGSDSRG